MPTTRLTRKRTHPLVWLAAILCAVTAMAVIVVGIVALVGYMIIRPKLTYLCTTYAHLDTLSLDHHGQMGTQITLTVAAVNENTKVHSTFSHLRFLLRFRGVSIADLRADPFDVPENSTLSLPYVIHFSSIPLEKREMEDIGASLKRNRISFNLKGGARARWKAGGILGSVRFYKHLSCQLVFFPSNGTSVKSHWTSNFGLRG